MDASTFVARLKQDGLSVAVAESCTGGMLQSTLVDVPGVSEVFLGGVVAYADAVKTQLLGVDAQLLGSAGAVSASVAEAMAHGIRDHTEADVAIAITGVAGPTGGADNKPVGTVWVAVLGPAHVMSAQRLHLEGDRHTVRHETVHHALQMAMNNIAEWEQESK